MQRSEGRDKTTIPNWIIALVLGVAGGGGAGSFATASTSSSAVGNAEASIKAEIRPLNDKLDRALNDIDKLDRKWTEATQALSREDNLLRERVRQLEIDNAKRGAEGR